MLDLKACTTPMSLGNKLSTSNNEPFLDPTLYRSTIGGLQYLTLTRPDLSFPVNKPSQFMHSPTTNYWFSCKRVLRYIHASFCVMLEGNLITLASRRKKVVSRSSTESKYRALSTTTTELVSISSLLHELGITLPQKSKLSSDNQGAQTLASNPIFYLRTKYIEVDVHYVRELV
uniref:Uncharacterized protein n=1 Tax=Cannabis sativa TaxID=3483 RepID=A0A803Q8Z7_CANSA